MIANFTGNLIDWPLLVPLDFSKSPVYINTIMINLVKLKDYLDD